MNLSKVSYFFLLIISTAIAFTQTNAKLIFADMGYGSAGYGSAGYGSAGYGSDPTGYIFDQTGYYSPTITYFDGPETSDKNVGFDTRVVPFSSLNWDAALTLDESPNVFVQELSQNGHIYRSTTTYELDSFGEYSTVTGFEFVVDREVVIRAINLDVPTEAFALYEGAALMFRILADGEVISGGSADDNLYGFNGDDSLRGNAGNDVLSGGWGINYLSGGDGVDTAIYDYDDADYALSKNPVYGFVEILVKWGGSLGVVLDDVEKLEFRNTILEYEELSYVGTYSRLPSISTSAVRRFYNTKTNSFFYSASKDEANYLIEQSSVNRENVNELSFVYQGGTFEAAHSYRNSVGLHRFYDTVSEKHFFTASTNEADFLRRTQPSAVYEGIAFNVYQWDPNPGFEGEELAVYRFYNSDLNRHFWTANDSEIVLMNASDSWNNEGVVFYGEKLGN